MWQKTIATVVSIFNIYYIGNYLQSCTGTNSYQHAGTHLQKAATFSHSPATTGRELQPPDLVYQPLLEGSYYPLISFTSYHQKEATTPSLKASTLNTIMDHVSSIFILHPSASIQHTLQATFHHIFRVDPLHTFKPNAIQQTETYNYTK